MEIVKGKHIIPKRDKVTYATNICGKWENYSVDTYEGKVLKEATERYKLLLKNGFIDDNEFISLKNKMTSTSNERLDAPVDLWSLPQPEEHTTTTCKAEEIVVKASNEITTDKISCKKKWVVTAGLNKIGRQLYISSYDDAPNDWSISVVPYPTTKTRCEQLIALAKRDLEIQYEQKKFKAKKTDIPFAIKEWQIDNKVY